MATNTSLEMFNPFFGGDKKGSYLIQAMFNGTNYTDRVGLKSGLLTELMRAENYKNYQNVRSTLNQQAQGPEDVPQDLTDLIITTALFHQSIDKSSTAGTNLGAAIQRISDAAKMFFKATAPLPSGYSYRSSYVAATTVSNQFPQSIYSIPSNTMGDITMFQAADRAAWDLYASNNRSAKRSTITVDQLNPDPDHVNNVTTNNIADNLFDCAPISNSKLPVQIQTLCFNSIYATNPDPSLTSIIPSAKDALDALAKAGATGVDTAISTAVSNVMKSIFKKLIVQMKKDLSAEFTELRVDDTGNNKVLGRFNALTVQTFMTPDRLARYNKMFLDMIDAEVTPAIKNVVNTSVTVPHTTLVDVKGAVTPAKAFFDAVYGSWSTMHPDIRKFYTQNVSVFARTTSRGLYDTANDPFRQQQLQMDWVRLTDNELDNLFKAGRAAFTPAELKNLRVNLMKDPLTGFNDVLFGANLPDITPGVNVWYTQANGGVAQVQPLPPVSFLRDLYASAYATTATANLNVVVNGATFELKNLQTDLSKRPLGNFNFDYRKFTESALRREDALMDTQTQQASTPASAELDYPFLTAYDMVYGQLWTFDSQKGQYYRLDEFNRKIYYDEAARGDTKTCYATYLSKGSDQGCIRVIQCIIDGNSKSLNRCLDVIGDGNLWDVAADDARKVGPDMIKLVLRKFGVKGYDDNDSNGVKYRVPMSFEEWKTQVVANFSDDVKNTILSNTKLLNYLKSLIGVCRSNPNILNKNNPSIIARDNTPEYIKNLNMRKYKIPSVSKKSQYEFFAESLRNATQPHVITQDLFNPITSGSFSNTMFFNPMTTMVPSMMGGNYYAAITPALPTRGTSADAMSKQSQILKQGSASMFSTLLGTISNAFADTGLTLHQTDKDKLQAVVRKMETYENQLARMCDVLINIVKLARFYGVGLDNIDKDHPRVMKLSELTTIDDIREFVRGYAKELTKNMVSNMTVQQAAAYELMNKVGPRLLDDCTGKQPSAVAAAKAYVDI